MKYLLSLPLVFFCVFFSTNVSAETIGNVVLPASQPPTLAVSPIIITSAAMNSNGPLFAQIYNNSDSIQDLRGWSLSFIAVNTKDQLSIEIAKFDKWIEPRSYMVVSLDGAVSNSDNIFSIPTDISSQISSLNSKSFQLDPPGNLGIAPATFVISVFWPQWLERNKTTKYLETFSTKTGPAQLFGGGTYLPPEDTAGLEIVEILANAKDCSPLETTLDCSDFIKLFNTGYYPIDLANYRLRTDSGGSKSSTSNTFKLTGNLLPGQYITLHLKDSGDAMSITNDGGYVWLEDTYGVQVYDPVIDYPDMTYKQGQSWAYDSSSLSWSYMIPAPDAANYWPPVTETTVTATVTSTTTSSASVSADCGEGKERNPETNRCRTIVSATTTATALAPCAAGQERNPQTNRCRSIVGASATLAACAVGQERNPETNRCRSILAATTTKPAPCPTGQERNPETNRCRKITANATEGLTTIADIKSVEKVSMANWFIAAAAIVAALCYAIYEWRSEIMRWTNKNIRSSKIG